MRVSESEVRKDSRLFEELTSALLRRGHAVQFRVHGQSMTPNLRDGDQVVVAPVNPTELHRGDVVLAQNLDGLRVHRLHSVDTASRAATLRSDTGLDFDPPAHRIFGKVVSARHGAHEQQFTAFQTRFVHPLRVFARRLLAAGRLRLRRLALLSLATVLSFLVYAVFFAPTVHGQTADLQLTQTASAPAVAAGSNVTYTETVINNTSSAMVTTSTINVYMQTPANANYQSYSGTNWSCTTPATGGTGPIICTYNTTLASGATASALTVTLQVANGTAAGTFIQASATVTNSTFTDTVPSNNTSVTTIVVEPATSADLGVSMSVTPTPVFVSSTMTYTITVQNLGQASAAVNNNVLQDNLPGGAQGVTFSSIVIPSGWSCTTPAVGSSGNIQCSITTAMPAQPAAGSTVTFAVTVNTPATATTITNTATVNLPGDPNNANNSATSYTVVQPLVCATPGKDGAGGTLTGIVNAYYPPANTGNLNSGSTSLALGAAASGGAQKAIGAGDLLLIIQMQDASINNTNTSSYGSGLPGVGYGSTSLASSGFFEFVTAISAVPVTGGTLNFTGTGNNSGLLNSYSYATASGGQGQQTYQVIRVPQYTSATLSSGLVPLAWNGSVGGVLAIDVSSQLTLGGTVAADLLGFRGAGGRILKGDNANGLLDTDYLTLATYAANGSKGEGIAGTPRYLSPVTSTIVTTTTAIDSTGGAEGLPNGSYARGGPGNAGGGGTDGDPATANPNGNDENSGGGGGGNGGAGGYGGYGWNTFSKLNSTDGGFGGAAFPASTSALVMGGSGGAGTTNNGAYYISPTNHGSDTEIAGCSSGANPTCTGIFSSGGFGGGMVIIHAGAVTGTGTITSNGGSTLSTDNDSTGGGGAGGSILVFANSGGLSGLTVDANGGSAGNTWPLEAPGGFPGNRHGPGGGGAGGVVFLSSAPAATSVLGGNNGYSTTVQDSYGATPGQPGIVSINNVITETPGTQSGAYCAGADLAVTNSGSPAVVQPGGNITYTQTVTNNGPLDAVNVVFSEGIPANTTFQSINTVAGWTCTTPAVGTTGTITCTDPDFANAGNVTFTVVVQVGNGTAAGTEIVDVDSVTSGTNDPNLANNTATAVSTVGSSTEADLAVTNTASAPTVLAGSNVTMTSVASNLGPAAASGVVFTETIPTNTTLGSAFTPPSGWSCNTIPVGGTGTFTCSINSFAANANATFTIVLNVNSATTSGTVISDTANIASPTPDPNYGNNQAIATTVVATAGQADLAVSASGTPNPVTPGNDITYTQSVTNNGPTAITAGTSGTTTTTVTFTDTIPANTTLAKAFTPPTGWTCNSIAVGSNGTFTCTLNSGQAFGIGTIFNFPLVVQVSAATAPGTTITNTPAIALSITGLSPADPNPANNTATVTTTVASPTQADVSIIKTGSPNPVDQGTNLTYTLTVTNAGPAVAQNVQVSDPLPAQVCVGTISGGGSCTYDGRNPVQTTLGSCTYTSSSATVSCNLGSLGVGSTAVITINVTAMTFSSSAYAVNTATVSSSTSDPNSANNTSTFTSTIQASTGVDLSAFNAYIQPDGTVRLVWHTQEESRNLGFHIYREDGLGRHRVDPSLIAGSALLLRGSKPQHAAKTYAAIDAQPAPSAAYWLEDIDINGVRNLHGPVYPEPIPAEQLQSAGPQNVSALPLSPSLNKLYSVANRPLGSLRPQPPVSPRRPLPRAPQGATLFNAADLLAVKISVDHEGWYRIPFSQLFAAGLSASTEVQSLHLYAEGVEQQLLLVGHTAGLPSPSDAIEFYGTGIDTPFTADRVYWLVSESVPGQRILPVSAVPSEAPAPTSFPFSVISEDRTVYFAALLNGDNNDNYFGAVITSEPVQQTINVVHLDTSSAQPLALDLTLQGITDGQQHSVSVQFNGSNLGTFNFYGQVLATQSFSVDPSSVLNGVNTIALTALNGDNDVSVVQSIQLHYLHTYVADSDWLEATAPAGAAVHISGFANSQIRIFDVTNTLTISELTGKITMDSGSYGVTVELPPSSITVHRLLAFSADTLSSPAAITPHTPTLLDENHSGADVVIITHPDFVNHLAPLVCLRQSQGHTVDVVTTEQIFDQYNFGERSPFAMRTFLQQAVQNWQLKPQAILLVGDASVDPRNYLGFGDFDFVPTRIIETAALKTASDDWFTDFVQNGYATIPTGRLPARSTTDVDLMVSKIIGYEQGSDSGPWNSQALLIADQNVDANFTAAIVSQAASLPPWLQSTQILADGMDAATIHAQIVAALNQGALLVDYNGHGAEQQWSFVNLFDNNDAAALTNGGRLPVYLLMDCLNGLFQDVYAQSLSKALILAPNGGAVAVWASSGFTDQPPQASMDLALVQQLAGNPNDPLGLMILRAKSGITDNDVRRTWILFGDPSMKFHFNSAASASLSNSRSSSSNLRTSPSNCPAASACPKENR